MKQLLAVLLLALSLAACKKENTDDAIGFEITPSQIIITNNSGGGFMAGILATAPYAYLIDTTKYYSAGPRYLNDNEKLILYPQNFMNSTDTLESFTDSIQFCVVWPRFGRAKCSIPNAIN